MADFPDNNSDYTRIDAPRVNLAKDAVRIIAAKDPLIDLNAPLPENTMMPPDFDRASLDPLQHFVYLLKFDKCVEAFPEIGGKIYQYPRIFDAINDKPEWPQIDGALNWAPKPDPTKGIVSDPMDTRITCDTLDPPPGDYRNYQLCSWMFLALDLIIGREEVIEAYTDYGLESYADATAEQLARMMEKKFISKYKARNNTGYLPLVRGKIKTVVKGGDPVEVKVVKSACKAMQYIPKKHRAAVANMTPDSEGFHKTVAMPPPEIKLTPAFRKAAKDAIVANLTNSETPRQWNTRFYTIVKEPQLTDDGGVEWVKNPNIREIKWGDSVSVINGPPTGYFKAGYYGARHEMQGVVVYRMEHKHRSGNGKVPEVKQAGPAIDPSIIAASRKRAAPTELVNTRTSPTPISDDALLAAAEGD